MIKNQKIKGNLILMLTAFVWGMGFVAQSAGMDVIGANTFNGIRMLIGSLVLLPFAYISGKKESAQKTADSKASKKLLLIGGILCGAILCAASTIQTWGLAYTTAGKSGFITAMYIIFVPIIGIVMRQKITVQTIISALIAVLGMYMLCMTGDSSTINFGDFLTLICAVMFSVHIIAVDYFSPRVNVIQFACLQFFTCGVINIIFAFILESPTLDIIKQSAIPILYAGIFACGVGYTLQPIGQRYAEPTTASIIMSLESVFALLSGIVILGDRPSAIELLGCVVMFAAIILIQLPTGWLSPKSKTKA